MVDNELYCVHLIMPHAMVVIEVYHVPYLQIAAWSELIMQPCNAHCLMSMLSPVLRMLTHFDLGGMTSAAGVNAASCPSASCVQQLGVYEKACLCFAYVFLMLILMTLI